MPSHTDEQRRAAAEALWRQVVEELTPEAPSGEEVTTYRVHRGEGISSAWQGHPRVAYVLFRDPINVAEEVIAGIPVRAFDYALDLGVIQRDEIRYVLPERTYRGRRSTNEPLSLDESDRFARLLRIIELASETFGSTDKAHRWVRQPKRRFGGKTPMSMLSTSPGTQAVEDMLIQIAHGIAA